MSSVIRRRTKANGHQYDYVMRLDDRGEVTGISAGCRQWLSFDGMRDHYSSKPSEHVVTNKWSDFKLNLNRQSAVGCAQSHRWECAYTYMLAYVALMEQRAEARALIVDLEAIQGDVKEGIRRTASEARARRRKQLNAQRARKVVNLKAFKRKRAMRRKAA